MVTAPAPVPPTHDDTIMGKRNVPVSCSKCHKIPPSKAKPEKPCAEWVMASRKRYALKPAWVGFKEVLQAYVLIGASAATTWALTTWLQTHH